MNTNCYTCRFNEPSKVEKESFFHCACPPGGPDDAAMRDWLEAQSWDDAMQPPPTATGCPGHEAVPAGGAS